MSNATDSAMVALLNDISSRLNGYITLLVFLFGTIGNVLSIIVLSQARLRANPCVLYFLAASIASFGILLTGLPSRLMVGLISIDPTNTNSLLCKFRIFFLYAFRTTAVWLVVLATIDRWFASSIDYTRRRLSSRRFAHRAILIIHILSFILWIESPFCYSTNVPEAPLRCYGSSHACRIFNDLAYASSTVIIPSILMLIFGLLTIYNIHRTHRTIQPVIAIVTAVDPSKAHKRRKTRRNEISLTRMLLLQVVFLTFFSLPQAIHQFYLTLTLHITKSSLRIAVENFIVNLDFSLTYIGNAKTYILNTTTMTDRKAVIKNADMSEDMQQDAVDIATQALEKYNIEKDIAAYIKKEFDKKYNPTWHCIVGRNFGSYVTHETKHFIYFYLGQVAILLFKSG
ncbi:unnamed protein product [Adineta ricciae]|uniref:G-protein coupled receptors family 1 profile domain-containing protein n=15 Tax=Bdelloidea TaxID=44578 RepID=A0A814PGN7_ADIRI|nr:unnamed protein product [Adineta ricciae]